MGGKQADVLRCGTAGRKTGGRFDIFGAGIGDDLCQADFFILCQQAGFNDDFEDLPGTRRTNGADFIRRRIIAALFDGADIDHHVDFAGAVCHGAARFKGFDVCGMITVRKADDRADRQASGQIISRAADKRRRNADGRNAVCNAFITERLDFRPRCRRRQQRMVDAGQQSGLGIRELLWGDRGHIIASLSCQDIHMGFQRAFGTRFPQPFSPNSLRDGCFFHRNAVE